VFTNYFQDFLRHTLCGLCLDITIWSDFQCKVEGDCRIVLVYTQRQLIAFWYRVYIVQRREMPAIPFEDKTMISHVVICVGYGHVEHDSLPQLHQISLGSSTVGFEEGYQFEIAG